MDSSRDAWWDYAYDNFDLRFLREERHEYNDYF